jgi:predicted component of type VI protein secretion system
MNMTKLLVTRTLLKELQAELERVADYEAVTEDVLSDAQDASCLLDDLLCLLEEMVTASVRHHGN